MLVCGVLQEHICNDYTGQQRFCSMRKICFWCIFGHWIQICFQNFFITHSFRSRLKGWKLLRQDTKVCFYRGRHEEFKDFYQEDGVVFYNDVCSIMEVLGHEYNPDQWCLFIDSSKVSLKVDLLHNGDSTHFLWLMQPTWRKVMKAWSYCWERLSMTNLNGSFVVISGCGTVTWDATHLHKILPFPVWVGQPGQEESPCK